MQPLDHVGQHCPAQKYLDHLWMIKRNDRECTCARTRREADGIIRQLWKIPCAAQFSVIYSGKSIAHCIDGGRAIDR